MREIELKFKVNNLNEIIKKLEEKNCKISEKLVQYDTIYVENLDNVESTEGSIWLRVRKENDKIELNYKKQSKKLMESEEIEFAVSSYEKANLFLKSLGYKPWVEVNKTRRHTKYQDCNICIDEVEKLGSFIELELLINENNNVDYEKQLLAIAKELNIDTTSRVNSHYDTMIYELENKDAN